MTERESAGSYKGLNREEDVAFAEIPPGAAPPPLHAGDIHAWYFSLTPPDHAMAGLRALLNPVEKARADRFFRTIHQRRFTAGRALLRQLLASYLEAAPAELEFEYGTSGKPALRGNEIQFNLSHSGDIGLCAIARQHSLGIDVERLEEKSEHLKIARRFFAQSEYEQLIALPESDRLAGFYRCWTAKEALIKGWGLGLSAPLHDFAVHVATDRTHLESVEIAPYDAQGWSVMALPAPQGVVACLASDPASETVTAGALQRFPRAG